MENTKKLLYTRNDAAAVLGVSTLTIKRDIMTGVIKTVRYGRLHMIPASEIERIATEGLQTTTKPTQTESAQ